MGATATAPVPVLDVHSNAKDQHIAQEEFQHQLCKDFREILLLLDASSAG